MTKDEIAKLPTPKTDAAAHGFVQANPQRTDVDMWGIPCVDAEFARGLEQELAAALRVIGRISACLGKEELAACVDASQTMKVLTGESWDI